MTRLINFTRGEARALLHRLELGDTLFDVFNDTGRLVHMARDVPEAARKLCETLQTAQPFVCLHAEHELDGYLRRLDRELLQEAVEGSTWPACHRHESPQAYNGAVRCLWNARAKIAAAFGIDPESIQFPQV